MRRILACCVVIVLALAGCSGDSAPTASPTPTAAPPYIAEHIGLSSDAAVEACIEIEGATIAGRAALERAWQRSTIRTKAGRLCGLESVNACDGKGRWRHYIVGTDGRTRTAPLEPAAYTVGAGELDAWLYNPPGDEYTTIGIDFATVCEDELAGGP